METRFEIGQETTTENKSMRTLRKQKWSALLKALVDEKIERKESMTINGYIIYLDDMVTIRNEHREAVRNISL